MSLQPGMPAVPAFGHAADRELDDDLAATVRGTAATERDADGEPVGRSDLHADAVGDPAGDPHEQALNEDALDAFLSRDRQDGPGE